MKFKATRKALESSSADVIRIGYCDAQHLLHYCTPVAYNAGVYGWNFDAYQIGNTIIATGYRNLPGRDPRVDVGDFDYKARCILNNWNYPGDKYAAIDALLRDFIKQA